MCIKAIKSMGLKESIEYAKGHLEMIDMGKVLGVAGGLLEVNPKAVLKKLDIRDEDVKLKIKNKLNLIIDFLQWPYIMITGSQPWAY